MSSDDGHTFGPFESGTFTATWYAGGPDGAGQPDFSVHAYNANFFVLRQSACSNFEKPFLYLIFGRDRALLIDTGAGNVDVAGAVEAVVRQWLRSQERGSIHLVVTHSHNHGDHIAGDAQLAARPGITVVSPDATSVRDFFEIRDWPRQVVQYDLGERVLDVIPIPGHQSESIAFYDRRTGILLTGDAFYPGRLYVRDFEAYRQSIRRLVAFSAVHPITHILGTHIENTSQPYVDYPEGTADQPAEHVLQLARQDLLDLYAALDEMNLPMAPKVLPHFTIWPV